MSLEQQLSMQAWILTAVVIVATVAILVAIILDRRDRRGPR